VVGVSLGEDPGVGSERVDRALRPLLGLTVWQCIVDSEFKLRLFNEPEEPTVEVVVETDFRYVDPTGRSHALSPGDPQGLGPALGLLRQECVGASGDDEGCLKLCFADGSRLEVNPAGDHEAWEIAELGLIALPGGGLSLTPTPVVSTPNDA
jgi:hypothetical protein